MIIWYALASRRVKCPICLTTSGSFSQWMKYVHFPQITANVCMSCDQKFGKFHKPYIYCRSTDDTPFLCLLCNKNFAKEANFEAHWRYHNKKGICHVKFYKEYLCFNAMFNTHFGEDGRYCGVCRRSFIRKKHAKRHFYKHLCFEESDGSMRPKPFTCDSVCLKNFVSQANFNRHYYTTTAGKPYQCPSCEMRFAHIFSYRRHVMNAVC